MEKFKAGDKFIPWKPENDARWNRGMDKYEGHTFTVCDIINCADGLAITTVERTQMFLVDWCEKVGNSEIPNDHTPDVGKTIDWEQRRYELAKSAMQGILSNPVYYHAITVASDERNVNQLRGLVDISLQTAESMIKLLKDTDEIIKQLKGE